MLFSHFKNDTTKKYDFFMKFYHELNKDYFISH